MKKSRSKAKTIMYGFRDLQDLKNKTQGKSV